MSYRQVKTPNLDPVLYQGGEILYDWVGWCLLYVQTAFNSGWAGPDAWTSWISYTKFKHTNRNMPKSVYVPIWFDGYWNGKRYGHVAIYKDGKIWSSPYRKKYTADTFTSIADVERIYGMKFVGWSEDVNGKRVIQEVKTSTGGVMNTNLTSAQWKSFIKKVYQGFSGRAAKTDEVNFHIKNSNPLSFVNGFKDFKWQQLDKQLKDAKAAAKADKDKLNKQITRLTNEAAQERAERSSLEVDLQEAHSQLDDARARIKALEKQKPSANEQEVVQNWLLRLWNSLFKRGD